MIIRVQGPDGQKRLECDAGDTTDMLFAKVRISFGYSEFDLFRTRAHSDRIKESARQLASLGLKHGDMLYVKPRFDHEMEEPVVKPSNGAVASSLPVVRAVVVIEDDVDEHLSKLDGKIPRDKDPLCRHNDQARCVHCFPLEPYDEGYLKEKNIKHLSFHSYIRKLTGGADKGKFANLENVSCKIKQNCSTHLPWPKGVCSKCQPSALTLNLQKYRHVDCVMFENRHVVDRYIDFWRQTLGQRMGILYGKYEAHTDSVPLGIRAVVAAIYEPPQHCSREHLEMLPDPNEAKVDEIALKLGLRRVGWIFSDLLPLDMQKGTVRHLRSLDFSYLLSAQECITAGNLQNKYPNACKLSTDGHFGSKFVTVCVTGDSNNQIHMEGYQVSNQCMALVRDNCLVPTQDAAALAYVKESTPEQYVPDVFYKTKDSYGNEVSRVARPLPVEYLLVDVPVGSPNTPMDTFRSEEPLFVVKNRELAGQVQDLAALNSYLRNFTATKDLLSASRDFHFLVCLATLDVVHLPIDGLLKAVKNKDPEAAVRWAAQCEQWQTLETILSSLAFNDAPGIDVAGGGGPEPTWDCGHCTFTNVGEKQACEMCSLPRSQ